MTIPAYFRQFRSQIQPLYSSSEATTITEMLFEAFGNISRTQIIKESDKIIDPALWQQLESAKKRLLQFEPVQYIIGSCLFMGLPFSVRPGVLIPRPETEELVQWLLRETPNEPLRVLDIGTGSGCIAVSVKKKIPASLVTAIDISNDALTIAKENADNLNATIDFKLIDFLQASQLEHLGAFDRIISNPPYISEKEKEEMEKQVKDYEPSQALFVTNENPLIFYKQLALFGKSQLSGDGIIFAEIHPPFADEIKRIFESQGFEAGIINDMYGKKRMLKAIHSR